MGRMFVSAPCSRLGKLFCFNGILNTSYNFIYSFLYVSLIPYHPLQLDFAVTVSALLGIPFPYGRCSVSILSMLLLSLFVFFYISIAIYLANVLTQLALYISHFFFSVMNCGLNGRLFRSHNFGFSIWCFKVVCKGIG